MRQLLLAGSSTLIARLAGSGLALAVTIVLGRTLGPEKLGSYALLLALLLIAGVPISYGWGASVLREGARAFAGGNWSTALGIERTGSRLAVAVALSFATLGIISWLLGFSPDYSILIFALSAAILLFDQLSALRAAFLRACNLHALSQVPEMVIRPLGQLVCLGILMTGASYVSLDQAMFSLACGSAAAYIVGAVLLNRQKAGLGSLAKPARPERAWFVSAALLAGNSLFNVLGSHLSILTLGAFDLMREAGFYRVAAQISLVSGLGYTALNMVATQRFAVLRERKEPRNMRKEAQQLALLAFVASLPLPIIFAAQGPTLIAAVFGNQFLPALSTCLILMFGQCLNAAAGMASALLVMNGYEGQVIRVVGTAFIINLVLNLLLVPYFMADGAALATVISILVVNILLLRLAARRLRIDASVFGMLANKA